VRSAKPWSTKERRKNVIDYLRLLMDVRGLRIAYILQNGLRQKKERSFQPLRRKRFQRGHVRLRKDRGPAYWQGYYREDVANEAGEIERKRRCINLGYLTEVPSKSAAQQKLAIILEPINNFNQSAKQQITFREFIGKYRSLKLPNKKRTTAHGYETNIRVHYLPAFGNTPLVRISIEDVQAFLNRKALEGKAVQTLKNLKWGLSSIFAAAIKYGYISSNPAKEAELPSKQICERKELPTFEELKALIEHLQDPVSTAVWLVAVTSVRPSELAFKWKDLDAARRVLWVVRAVNRGKLDTPKYHRSNRPICLTEDDVQRLLDLKFRMNANDDDWMFPNSDGIGPIWHEDILGRQIQPVAKDLGLPHITWRLLRHWGATHMMELGIPVKTVQERLGHSRPDTLLKHYVHVLDGSAERAAAVLSTGLARGFSVSNSP
jgi:integrase